MYLFTRVKKEKTKRHLPKKFKRIVLKFFLHYFIKSRNVSSVGNSLGKLWFKTTWKGLRSTNVLELIVIVLSTWFLCLLLILICKPRQIFKLTLSILSALWFYEIVILIFEPYSYIFLWLYTYSYSFLYFDTYVRLRKRVEDKAYILNLLHITFQT